MTEKPLLLNGDMVRAVLAGRKTQTRRPATRFRVRLRRDVRSDVPMDGARVVAPVGDYDATLNQHGAVSIVVGDKLLGLLPGEFDFICPWADGHTYLRNLDDGRQIWTIKAHDSAVWVRETYALEDCGEDGERVVYAADRAAWWRSDPAACVFYLASDYKPARWRPSTHMPRWACRIVRPVVEVRLERLQRIDESDALDEGLDELSWGKAADIWMSSAIWPKKQEHEDTRDPRKAFEWLWSRIYGADSWTANPWVWSISFERVSL